MNTEELLGQIERAEALVNTGSDYASAGELAQSLLHELPATPACELRVRVLFVLSESLWRRGLAKESIPLAEQALSGAEELGSKDLIARASGNLGNAYQSAPDFKTALIHHNRALALAEELDNNKGMGIHLGNIGNIYRNLSDYPSAMEYFNKALALAEQSGYLRGVAIQRGNIGNTYLFLGDYPKALEYYQQSLAIHEELGGKQGLANQYGNIGLAYLELSNYNNALEYMHKALALHKEVGYIKGMAIHTGNIGNVYKNLGDYSTALEYYNTALALDEQTGNNKGIAVRTGNIANLYADLGEYPKSLEYHRKALALDEDIGNKHGISVHISNIGSIYANTAFDGYDAVLAEKYMKEALDMSEQLGTKRHRYDIHRVLAGLYEQESRWKEAYRHQRQFHELENEVQSEQARQKAAQIEQQKLIAEREKQLAVERALLEERERSVEELTLLNTSLVETLHSVELLNEQLISANNAKNDVIGIVAHDLKNPLASIKLNAEIIHKYNGLIPPAELGKSAAGIIATAVRMSSIINNLLDVHALETGNFKITAGPLNIVPVLTSVIQENSWRATAKSISLVDLTPVDVPRAIAEGNALHQVLDNVVSNAVKYSPQGSSVWIECVAEKSHIRISVRDQGPGILPEDKEKLFRKFQKLSARPTGGEHSSGLGLSIAKVIAETMGGSLECESEPGNGAEFILRIRRAE